MFINFYRIRTKIIEGDEKYTEEMMDYLKTIVYSKMDASLREDKNNFLYARILYIIALHLIKLEGVLLQEEDIELVIRALAHKKKFLGSFTNSRHDSSHMNSGQINSSNMKNSSKSNKSVANKFIKNLQSLLFLTF